MKVWDSELLIDKKPAEPVTDGLIMWIDGRDAPDGKKIKERINNSYMTPTGTQTGFTLSQSSDGLFLNINHGASAFCRYNFNGTSALTIEYVSSPDSLYGYACAYYNNNAYKELLYVSRNYTTEPYVRGAYKSTDSNTSIYFYPQTYPKQVVIRQDSVMYDGHKEPVSNMTIQTSFDIGLIINSWSTHLQKIGSIRAYNRVLTDKEILQNLEYEKSIGRVVL